MDLSSFDIEFIKLNIGKHTFSWHISPLFFDHFEENIVDKCTGDVKLVFEKINENLFKLDFSLKGSMHIECHRCLNEMEFPFADNFSLEMKVSEDILTDEVNLILVTQEEKKINVATYIYEFCGLQVPLRATCELIGKECEQKMIELLDKYIIGTNSEAKESDPRWNNLKNLKYN